MGSEVKEIKLGDTVILKPLKWSKCDVVHGEIYKAETIFCDLRVQRFAFDGEPLADCEWRFTYCVAEYYDEGSEVVESLAAGKRRAEQWYLQRIKNALEARDG